MARHIVVDGIECHGKKDDMKTGLLTGLPEKGDKKWEERFIRGRKRAGNDDCNCC
jgi:hypothetical protein